MLSLTCKAAIKSVIYIGSRMAEENRPGIREIARFIDENEHTVAKLLQRLVKEKVINSAKGPQGGFYLTPAQTRQPLLRIVEAIDGAALFQTCGLGLTQCADSHPCPLHDQYKGIRKQWKALCRNNRIIDLYQPVNSGFTHLIG